MRGKRNGSVHFLPSVKICKFTSFSPTFYKEIVGCVRFLPTITTVTSTDYQLRVGLGYLVLGSTMITNTSSVLVVDDEAYVCRLIEDVLSSEPVRCVSVNSGKEAMRLLLEKKFDIIILDLFLPDISGMDLLGFISSRGLQTRAICVTGAFSSTTRQNVLAAGAFDFFEKPFDMLRFTEAVRRAAERCTEVANDNCGVAPSGSGCGGDDEQVRRILLEATGALVHTVEATDPYTRRHSDHVAYYSERIARCVGVSKTEIESIRVAARLHDIGMIAVPDSVLTKQGKLSKAEFSFVRRHPDVGADILKNITMLKAEANLVRYHHENWDGSGYPTGLHGDNIPLGSQIISIADSIDAMLMHRLYKRAYSIDQMLGELDRCAGKKHATDLVRQAIDWCRKYTSKLVLPEKNSRVKTA